MIEFFERLLWDQAAFERYLRAALLCLAGLAMTHPDYLPEWLTPVLLAVGGLIGAGDKNEPKP